MSIQKKKQQPDRRANRSILTRTLAMMILFGVMAFVPLFYKLYSLQIVQHDFLKAKALGQQTRDKEVAANRGYIYDTKGTVLAMSATVQDIILSPKGVVEMQEIYRKKVASASEKGTKPPAEHEPTNEYIAENLAQILGIEKDNILKRLAKTNSMYEMIKPRVEQEQSDAVLKFMTDNKITTGIHVMPTTKRYYPYASLAAQVIGWVNPNLDNTGAYGLEAIYEEALSGTTGRVVTAKNGAGTQMLYRFEDYYDAVDGNNLTITLDATIQYYCERILEKGISTYQVQNGGFVIAMDPSTGAILAWANSPTFDLNQPWDITDATLAAQLQAVQNDSSKTKEQIADEKYKLQNQQWRNKAINDTYEPGSTFKSMVLAAALEEGVVNEQTTFSCTGSMKVADHTIRCSKRTGHGSQTLSQAVANSCNPAFIVIGQKLGASKFYDYLEDFGFVGKTGVDMQGEPDNSSLVWSRDYFTGLYGVSSLATASFGQRFKVTPIQMITAASAVVNGGHLMQPYVLKSITDAGGNIIEHTEPTEVRQTVSQQTSDRCRAILEGVVNGGTGKNAYQAGYRIGGKTGSSETTEADHTIVSFLGFAPADNPKVVVLLAFDKPKPVSPGSNYTPNGWYISGGVMAAPMAGELLANILDYMGVQKQYTEAEKAVVDTMVPGLTGLSLAEATGKLKNQNLNVRTVGDGVAVTAQVPAVGATIPGGSTVVLYMGTEAPNSLKKVPNVIGKSPEDARAALENAGLYIKFSGASGKGTIATSQSVAAGSEAAPGTVVEVSFVNSSSGAATGL